MEQTIESIIDDTGGFGLAQWIIIIVIFYSVLGTSWGMMQMAFAAKIPEWKCGEFKTHIFQEQDQQDLVYGNLSDIAETCSLNGSVCSTFSFSTDSERTTVNEWNLVCDSKWIPSFMISIQMAGVLFGSIMAGQSSERIGRRKSLLLATSWHTCANFAAFFSPNWRFFTACRFLIGVGIGGTFTIAFPYAIEFLPPNRRGRVAVFPVWTLAVAIFVGTAYILQHWRYLHLALAAFCVPIPALILFVPESIRWLTVEGRLDDAMAAAGKMARWNGKPVPPNSRSILEMIYFKKKQDDAGRDSYSYLDLFKSRYLMKCSLVVGFLWAATSLISYGISFGVHGLAGNLYLNILLTNCVEIPGLIPVLWLMDRHGRKTATVVLFSMICITTVVALGIKISLPGENSLNERAVFWFAIISKLFIDNVWSAIQAWTSELYPTTTRNLGFSVGMTSARIGGMFAPFFIHLKDHLSQTYVIILSLSLGAIFLCLLLPETRLQGLKDSMAANTSPNVEAVQLDMEEKVFIGPNSEINDTVKNEETDDKKESAISSLLNKDKAAGIAKA